MPSTWTANGQSCAAVNIKGVKLSYKSLAMGSCTFTVDGAAIDAPPLFAAKQTVTIAQDGVPRWQGPVVSPAAVGQGANESHRFELADAWFWLRRTVFMQPWLIRGGATTVKSARCILGRSAVSTTYGASISMGDAIREIINYAASCGRPVGAGTINLPLFFKQEEVVCITCMEAIQRILKWAPDAVAWWTFAGGNSLLNIGRRADLNVINAQVDGQTLTAVDLAPHPEMQPGSVILIYETRNDVNSQSVIDETRDIAPAGADGTEDGAIVMPVPMRGYNRHFLKERLFTEVIPMSPQNGGDDLQKAQLFWGAVFKLTPKAKPVDGSGAQKVPNLKFTALPSNNYVDRSLPMANQSDGSYDPAANADDDEKKRLWREGHPLVVYNATTALNARKVVIDLSLTNHVTEGQPKPWMNGVTSQHQVFALNITYTDAGNGNKVGPAIYTALLNVTNATTRTYTALEGEVYPETAPTGLAAAMYAGLNHANYSGTVQRSGAEYDGAFVLGSKLNVVGGQAGWAGMLALIQQVDVDVDQGTQVAHVGPPAHLGPRDFITLLEGQRASACKTGAGNGNMGAQQYGLDL